MRILYLSVHEILEYDELKLFSEIGYECYSLGAYTQPGGQEHRKRPALPQLPYDPHFIELSLNHPKESMHPDMLKNIDVIIIMHDVALIEKNWQVLSDFIQSGRRVIWRAIGQSIPHVEERLATYHRQGVEIVRYSPAERTIMNYAGEDALIRFYKDPEEYGGWNGQRRQAINFTQSLPERDRFVGGSTIRYVFEDLPAKVYGPQNEALGLLSGGLLSSDAQRQAMREARVYLNTGTYPASYTLSFIEAMMTGIPMVCAGKRLGNSRDMFPTQDTYEVADIVQHGVSGYVSDDPKDLRMYVERLLNDEKLAKSVSTFGRARAIELFGKAKIKQEWREFLEGDRK